MTLKDIDLLTDLSIGRLTNEEVLLQFSIDLRFNDDFIRSEIEAAIEHGDPFRLNVTVELISFLSDIPSFVDVFNQLLITSGHKHHQVIAKTLQDKAPSPTTVPFVRKIFESGLTYLSYTGSESLAIAGWFSHLLAAIGNEEAIDLIRELSKSPDEGVAQAMSYRLKKKGYPLE